MLLGQTPVKPGLVYGMIYRTTMLQSKAAKIVYLDGKGLPVAQEIGVSIAPEGAVMAQFHSRLLDKVSYAYILCRIFTDSEEVKNDPNHKGR